MGLFLRSVFLYSEKDKPSIVSLVQRPTELLKLDAAGKLINYGQIERNIFK